MWGIVVLFEMSIDFFLNGNNGKLWIVSKDGTHLKFYCSSERNMIIYL